MNCWMNYNYNFTATFAKKIKILLKKHKSIKQDILDLQAELETNPNIGVDLSSGFRKIRLKISSTNNGKSGGGRVVIHELVIDTNSKNITFVTIWKKNEIENIDINRLKNLI